MVIWGFTVSKGYNCHGEEHGSRRGARVVAESAYLDPQAQDKEGANWE